MLVNRVLLLSLLFVFGIPTGDLTHRPFVSESQILTSILDDLRAAADQDRPYLRYYSSGNLWNNPEIEAGELVLYRGALSKLVNHLSWKRDVTPPQALGPEGVILRVDL